MYAKTTIFDLVLPRVLAGENIGRRTGRTRAWRALHKMRDMQLSDLSFWKIEGIAVETDDLIKIVNEDLAQGVFVKFSQVFDTFWGRC